MQVRFDKGNLQYQASTGTWRFAEHQYDFIGLTNSNVSSTYDGWIDLFGWGTSDWSGSGTTCHNPYDYTQDDNLYCAASLTGIYKNADWGVYNRNNSVLDDQQVEDYESTNFGWF